MDRVFVDDEASTLTDGVRCRPPTSVDLPYVPNNSVTSFL